MVATAGPVSTAIRHWDCRCCGFRLGVLVVGELRVLVDRQVRRGQSVAVRCPSCRSRERFDLALVVDPARPVT